jgi:hypothetical protein
MVSAMEIRYAIDAARGLVTVTVTGDVAARDIAGLQARLRADPEFRPEYHQLYDFRVATPTDLYGSDVDALLESSPHAAVARRAYVVSPGVGYGMARMAEAMGEARRLTVRAFLDLEAARRWLATGGDA